MSAEVLRESAVAMREDWTIRAGYGDQHAVFHLAVADWLDAEAATLDAVAQFNNVGRELVSEHGFQVKGAAISVYQEKSGSIGISVDTSTPALAVARAYLGGEA